MDIPEKHDLEDDCDEDNDEDGEKHRLVIEHSDGLRRGADFAEPIELTHGELAERIEGESRRKLRKRRSCRRVLPIRSV